MPADGCGRWGVGTMPPFSEVTRIEAAIKNKSAKELEWSLWYCRMRQTAPSARPADVKYWSGIEEKVLAVMAPAVAETVIRLRRSGWGVGWGWGKCLEPARRSSEMISLDRVISQRRLLF